MRKRMEKEAVEFAISKMPYFCQKLSNTMLDHIHIENFRLFKELDIPKVGQVNLITGKNNAGKTTLLEALRLCGNQEMSSRSNKLSLNVIDRGDSEESPEVAYKSLFHERNIDKTIKINENELSYRRNGAYVTLSFKSPFGSFDFAINTSPKIIVSQRENGRPLFIPVTFLLMNSYLWRDIDLTDKVDKVIKILRIIEPNIVGVSINEADGSAKIRLSNTPKPIPLKNFGEGMNRLLTIALGLVSAENDMLLIDEIDLGLHHSVQHMLWEIVFQKAKDLNVQVFATTHSSDCVEAFSDIANKSEYDGMGNYIRLQRSKKDGNIMAVDYEMEQLDRSLEFNLETR